MKNFIEVHYKDGQEIKPELINIAHIVCVKVVDTDTYLGLSTVGGDSDCFYNDTIRVIESYKEIKQAIIIAQSN